MLTTAARPHSARGQLESVRTPETTEPLVHHPVAEEAMVVRVALARRRPGFLSALLRALSALSV